MKIALMSGAYVNAGDFLIEDRCKELLETNLLNTYVDILKRNISYDDQIERLNSYDLIVFGGGGRDFKRICTLIECHLSLICG